MLVSHHCLWNPYMESSSQSWSIADHGAREKAIFTEPFAAEASWELAVVIHAITTRQLIGLFVCKRYSACYVFKSFLRQEERMR